MRLGTGQRAEGATVTGMANQDHWTPGEVAGMAAERGRADAARRSYYLASVAR